MVRRLHRASPVRLLITRFVLASFLSNQNGIRKTACLLIEKHLNHSQITQCGICFEMSASPFGLGTNHQSVQGIDLHHNRYFAQNDGNFDKSKTSRGKNIKLS
jgi:hypothetical protein